MTSSFTLSLPEIALFVSAAIVLGVTIRLYTGMRSTLKTVAATSNPINDEWKTKYMSDIPKSDKEITGLKEKLKNAGDHIQTLSTKAEELRWQYRQFESIKEGLEKKLKDAEKKNLSGTISMEEKRSFVTGGR